MNIACKHYDICRLPTQLCNTKCGFSDVPEGWRISLNPKPIPDRRHDYDYYHEDYDGENGLCGTAASPEDAAKQIKDILLNS